MNSPAHARPVTALQRAAPSRGHPAPAAAGAAPAPAAAPPARPPKPPVATHRPPEPARWRPFSRERPMSSGRVLATASRVVAGVPKSRAIADVTIS